MLTAAGYALSLMLPARCTQATFMLVYHKGRTIFLYPVCRSRRHSTAIMDNRDQARFVSSRTRMI